MGRIIVLDETTAGRIAAGEVVERPASVAKELVENALDAGATRIEVELEDGGRSLVKVSDNGEGMDAGDCRLAFERHATSKLGAPEDLEKVATYGFRGEALPSVAAVAQVRLLTCPPGASEGTEVVWEGGRLVSSGPGPARAGTVVWVRDLFFNTRARREALRSAAAETARVSEVVGTLALASPHVSVTLTSDGRRLWSTPGGGRLEEAVAALLGPAFASDMVPVVWTGGAVKVTGLTGRPTAARRDGKRQYLFCNRRPIAPHLVRAAVEEAYRGLLEAGRTPVFVLNLELPPAAVDVNVHPAKTFVRFRDHGQVHRAVLVALRAALSQGDLFAGRLYPDLVAAGLERARETAPGADEAAGVTVPGHWREMLGGREAVPGLAAVGWAGPEAKPRFDPARLEPLGQVGDTFIVGSGPDGLYVIDQHAAHERVVYERLLAGAVPGAVTGAREETSGVQVLAVPETLEVAPGEEEALESSLAFLREVGFEIEPFGGRAFLIRAIPAALAGVSAARLVSDFLDRLGAEEGRGLARIDRFRAARTMAACRAALKAGQPMSLPEMRALLSDLGGTSEPRTCPHGRPTVLKIGLDELRRGFGRSRE